ncbi:flagellar FliJ family protein [Nocardioides euryhalodurans]|uniref:Flagellar FliJ protein n=1 Tax=Nocardioides euryhalodurans TaxID=2518370 RepID=A0A4P7GKS4_9ACTN|nr:flagellar FliJ family protein [Nocardioides euryhalodurans]QBR92374.1 hypothetical protein EXE57_08805 [Nocardioides euryhalodurans]
MSTGHPDAGMLAVARVRGVREQDSRLGLRRALTEEQEAGHRVALLEERLARSTKTDGSVASYLAVRASHQALAADAARAREALLSAGTVAVTARDHWQRDKTRLSAVELLLERRAERRREERLRREAGELDDVVAGRWLRARREEGERP